MKRPLLVVAVALAAAGGASGEVVAPRVQDGMLAVGPSGTPLVAYVRGAALEIAARSGHWRTQRAGTVRAGSSVVAFAAGVRGPVAVVVGPNERTLLLVQRRGARWAATELVRRLPAGVVLGPPGLALDRRGRPVVAYTRWRRKTRDSALMLARLDARGHVRTQQVTLRGFPKSYVPPPAAPVFRAGVVHVIESYGFDGAVGTIDWYPLRKTWEGQFIDGGVGDFPVGSLFAGVAPGGTIYAAWSEALLGTGELPVTLAVRPRSAMQIASDFVLDRALTTGLALTRAGPEVAANEWLGADEVGLSGDGVVWAGQVVAHGGAVELDGWIAGLASAPRGARDLLLAGPTGLSWFRSPKPLAIHVEVHAAEEVDGTVHLDGRVLGATGGSVVIYRERPGSDRTAVGTVSLTSGGSFSLDDHPPQRPLLYRAVYVDPTTGIPYAALLRQPIS
jgi:hypothetical protein